jgi:ABC-2 type transport system ATP-binding protein
VRLSRRLLVAAGAALVLVLAVASAAVALAGREPAVRAQALRVPGVPEPGCGPVSLDATLYLPDVPGPVPAVLLAHGFGGSKDDLADDARLLAQDGYVVLAYTARGFGTSGGLVHLDAPNFEVADARRMLDVLANRPEVLKDGPGDPRVGVAGGSYGGALALLLAGYDERVDAIAPQITWNDLGHALFPQFAVTGAQRSPAQTEPTGGSGVFKQAWAGVFLGPGGAASSAAQPSASNRGGASDVGSASRTSDALACGRLAPGVCSAYQQVAVSGQATPAILALLRASSPATVLDRITAPALLVQGEADSLFPLSEADANARGIAAHGTPVKVVWYGGGHDGGLEETDRVRDLVLTWFGRYLERDGSPADTRFEVTVPAATISSADSNPAAQVRVAPAEPGIAPGSPSTATRQVELSGPPQPIVAPAGGSPAAVSVLPGLGGALGALAGAAAGGSGASNADGSSGGSSAGSSAGSAGGASGLAGGGFGLAALPGQVAIFESPRLDRSAHIVGASRVRLRVSGVGSSSATLFAQLYDVGPGGGATLPEQLVTPLRLSGPTAAGEDVTVSLPAVVRDVATGHRLRLVISTTDQAYALPARPAQYQVALAPGALLAVPIVPMSTLGGDGGLASLLPWAIALLAATAVVVVGFTVAGSRRARSVGDLALADVPLAVEGLGKRYGDGYRAVSDVSFKVEHGWVLGLLGPNGAGKTTTLRMLMGLITPTEGQITVFGHPVRPGAPVLSRVGSFVEGPGFLPHVSGLENLRLYWGATGRPEAEAHMSEALEIAGLGDDIHRRVRTYSHGMRQRLAIAQAMLGLPDLLVLDEPTNGLDPPQIREMREVLARYAATGRTVVVSSHLLAEVEQTSTHVVVMNHGQLVAHGPVSELVGSATVLVVDVDRPERAAEVAASLDGARDVEVTATGIRLKLVGTTRSELVRLLVADDLAVSRVAPQRGLEEAFLALVGEG